MKCPECNVEIGMTKCPVVLEARTVGCIKHEMEFDVLYVPVDLSEESLIRVACPFCNAELSAQIRVWWYSDEFDEEGVC